MGIMLLTLSDEIEEKLRKQAGIKYGVKKYALRNTVTEALILWFAVEKGELIVTEKQR